MVHYLPTTRGTITKYPEILHIGAGFDKSRKIGTCPYRKLVIALNGKPRDWLFGYLDRDAYSVMVGRVARTGRSNGYYMVARLLIDMADG